MWTERPSSTPPPRRTWRGYRSRQLDRAMRVSTMDLWPGDRYPRPGVRGGDTDLLARGPSWTLASHGRAAEIGIPATYAWAAALRMAVPSTSDWIWLYSHTCSLPGTHFLASEV